METQKGASKSGVFKQGSLVKAFLSWLKDSSHCGVHSKLPPFAFVAFVSGYASTVRDEATKKIN